MVSFRHWAQISLVSVVAVVEVFTLRIANTMSS